MNYPLGATGYAHATMLTMPPGTKVLSHWHDDREAVFYCVAGEGLFVLDDVERRAMPGHAMLQPLHAAHSFVATGDAPFHFVDFALLTGSGPPRRAEECFVHADEITTVPTAYGEDRPLFSDYGNPAIQFVGERRLDRPMTHNDIPSGTEQILLVLHGTGELDLLDETISLRSGSIMYLIEGIRFRIEGRMRLLGTSSRPGRIREPPYFAEARRR